MFEKNFQKSVDFVRTIYYNVRTRNEREVKKITKEKKDKRMEIRLTQSEKEMISSTAKKAGLSNTETVVKAVEVFSETLDK